MPPELNETLSAYLLDAKGWGADDFALKIKSVNKEGMLVVWATHATNADASVSLVVHPDSHDVVTELAFQ